MRSDRNPPARSQPLAFSCASVRVRSTRVFPANYQISYRAVNWTDLESRRPADGEHGVVTATHEECSAINNHISGEIAQSRGKETHDACAKTTCVSEPLLTGYIADKERTGLPPCVLRLWVGARVKVIVPLAGRAKNARAEVVSITPHAVWIKFTDPPLAPGFRARFPSARSNLPPMSAASR